MTALATAAACGGVAEDKNEVYGGASEAPGDPNNGSTSGNGGGNGSTSSTSASSTSSSGNSSSGASSSTGGTSSSSTSSSSGNVPQGTDATDPKLKGIVAAHNLARSRVSPAAATPIPALNWSDSDAAVAKAYAAKCVFQHNPNRGPRGENLYAASGGTNTPEKVVGSWESEKAQYNYANNSCSGVCGHYTQVVWAATTTVGCAVQTCTQNSPFGGSGPWELWVCNYSPAGNFVGKKPY